MNSKESKLKATFIKNLTSSSVRTAKICNKSNTKLNTPKSSGTVKTPKATWITPRPPSTFLTKGVLSRRVQTTEFAYDLSQDENLFTQKFPGPMKALTKVEKELQQSSARSIYLNTRYERFPERKYNFPEATSWRIGWFHSQQQSK